VNQLSSNKETLTRHVHVPNCESQSCCLRDKELNLWQERRSDQPATCYTASIADHQLRVGVNHVIFDIGLMAKFRLQITW